MAIGRPRLHLVSRRKDGPGLRIAVFFKVLCGADPVENGEEARAVKGRKDAMPSATVQVDALRAIGQKGAGGCVGGGGHNDQEWFFSHRQEGLRAFGVALDQIKGIRERSGFGVKDREARARF